MNFFKVLILIINFISISYMLYYVLIGVFAFKKKSNYIEKKKVKNWLHLYPSWNAASN